MRTRAANRRPDLALAGVFVLAFALRVAMIAHSRGGFGGDIGYDSSVYYAAADSILHGRMPYADFTLLHPPALPLVLTPFAYLGTLTSDHTGFIVANVAFEALGALNAVLVVLVARRAGAPRAAAVVGGIFYAAWPGAITAELYIRLEPLGNFFLLCALLVLVRARRDDRWSARALAGCGALLGAACVVKIWWAVALLVVLVWAVITLRRRSWPMIAGAAAAIACIAGPFAAYSPRVMWRMIVSDQFVRPPVRRAPLTRIAHIVSPGFSGSHAIQAAFTAVVAIVAIVAVVYAWRLVAFRLAVVLGVAQFAVLVAAPTYFHYYSDFIAPAVSLLLAGAIAGFGARRAEPRGTRVVAVACVAVLLIGAVADVVAAGPSASARFPGAALAAAASRARVRCVVADSPMALIELDVLSPDLARGCPNRVDVSGSTYDRDRPSGGRHLPRRLNLRWQRDLLRYLLSGNAEIVIRHATGISAATKRRLDRLPVIFRVDGQVLRRTR